VPGHEDFVRNMVAGVGSIDLALFVVAADDGWMPQTEEHLQILLYLGVRAAVVALTKIDLAVGETAVTSAVRDRLRGTAFADAEIVPTSIPRGTGIDPLKAAIAKALDRLAPPADTQKPRLPIDRVFALKGIGTIVTGTLIGGSLKQSQEVVIQPERGTARLRTLQSHGQPHAVAVPGSRVAANIVDLSAEAQRNGIQRGDVITVPSLGRSSTRLCVCLSRSSRGSQIHKGNAHVNAIKDGSTVFFHHATAAVPARVRFLNTRELPAGSECVAILSLKTPLMTFAGDRFIVRDGSQQHTIAGGTILDPDAAVPRQRRDRYHAALIELAHKPNDPVAHIQTQLARDPVLPCDRLLLQSGFTTERVNESIVSAVAMGVAVTCGNLLIAQSLWKSLRESLVAKVGEHHRQHPELAGLTMSAFRSAIAAGIGRSVAREHGEMLEQPIVESMQKEGFVFANGVLRHRSHMPELPLRLREAGEALRRQMAAHPFDAPSRKELCPTDVKQQAMRFLIASGAAIELTRELVISTDAFQQAIARIRAYLAARQAATVTELKTLLGSSRRVMVPLLERLDRDGITQRQGDLRTLRQA
jgi:selenocysteine-specific elongation factor